MKLKAAHIAFPCALALFMAAEARAVDPDLVRFVTAMQPQIRENAQPLTNKVHREAAGCFVSHSPRG
jgi:hypothetical protein